MSLVTSTPAARVVRRRGRAPHRALVRLHRIDENTASEVAPLLAYLRALQRELGCAVVLVHHARKGGHARAGQALRCSSELHAWGDSNLYLRRDREQLLLSIEHRAAAGVTGIELELAERRGGLALHVREDMAPALPEPPRTPVQRVLVALEGADAPLTCRELRDACRLRNALLVDVLAESRYAECFAIRVSMPFRLVCGLVQPQLMMVSMPFRRAMRVDAPTGRTPKEQKMPCFNAL